MYIVQTDSNNNNSYNFVCEPITILYFMWKTKGAKKRYKRHDDNSVSRRYRAKWIQRKIKIMYAFLTFVAWKIIFKEERFEEKITN